MTTKRWNDIRYQKISSVKTQDDELLVSFQDGTTVSLNVDRVLPPDVNNPVWSALSYTDYEIVVPIASGEAEIPWTTIRLLTDKEFATYWANAAGEQAQQIGLRLKELRKRRDLTSKEVAERAGIAPQSLSRIERGSHDVTFTTLQKILGATGCTLRDLADVHVNPVSLENLLSHLENLGLKKEWVLKRMISEDLLAQFELVNTTGGISDLLKQVARHIGRIFNWSPESILNLESLTLDHGISQAARFKVQGRTQMVQATAYAVYAHFLSLLILDATKHLEVQPLPQTPEEVRRAVVEKYRFLTFESLLNYVWDLGIPVIPLHDPGAFHGACWRIGNRNIIVLKQVTSHQARWLFDLIHELGHVTKHLSNERMVLIEPEEISPFQDSDEEWEASEFATALLLRGRAEELAEMSAERARGKVEYLKSAVYQVATGEGIPVDVLANYVAYRLSKANNINWWGAANKLQVTEPTPLEVARQVFFARVNLDLLSPEDRALVMQALD